MLPLSSCSLQLSLWNKRTEAIGLCACMWVESGSGSRSAHRHVLLHAYLGVNPALGARCWWQSKSWKRRASETVGEEKYCRFETSEETKKKRKRERHWRKRYHWAVLPSSPLFATFDIYSVTFNAKRKSLSFHLPFHPFTQRASRWPHKLNIIPLLTNHLVKSPFPCLIPPCIRLFVLYSGCFVHFCSMLAAVWPLASGLATNFIWTGECVFSRERSATGDTQCTHTYCLYTYTQRG